MSERDNQRCDDLIACYLTGQMSEAQWQEHLAHEPGLAERARVSVSAALEAQDYDDDYIEAKVDMRLQVRLTQRAAEALAKGHEPTIAAILENAAVQFRGGALRVVDFEED